MAAPHSSPSIRPSDGCRADANAKSSGSAPPPTAIPAMTRGWDRTSPQSARSEKTNPAEFPRRWPYRAKFAATLRTPGRCNGDRKSTRLNSSHPSNSYAVFCLKKKIYYTTGRRPVFPVLLFDVTNNPYTPEQIADMARERGIKWLIVKNDRQVDTDKSSGDKTIDDKDAIFDAMKPDFKHIESLNNYEIYRRKMAGETDDEDEVVFYCCGDHQDLHSFPTRRSSD